MAQAPNARETWLVAVWPGMGSVAVAAGAFLVTKLGARPVGEVPAGDVFEIGHIDVRQGLASPGRLPRSLFFEWRNPSAPRDLLIFVGEAQPQARGLAFCQRLLEAATEKRVTRVVTFAALATQLHPSDAPRVFGVATQPALIDEFRTLEMAILQEGQISGLNGVLLAAAAERSLPAICLMGELPYFAAAVPNPKASLAVLEAFATMAGIEVDFSELREQAEAVERGLIELLEKLEEAARQQAEASGEEGFTVPDVAISAKEEEAGKSSDSKKAPELDAKAKQRIEALFAAAGEDRNRAFQLKQELDRLGVFKHYEDRFLDLFRKAE